MSQTRLDRPSLRFAQTPNGLVVAADGHFWPLPVLENIFQLTCAELFQTLLEATQGTPLEEAPELQNFLDPTQSPILGAGVTFSNSHRERRMEALRAGSMEEITDDGRPTPYDVVYDPANPPEVFFKAIRTGHLAAPNELWIRPDGGEDGAIGNSVPEPERVLIVNKQGEIIAETLGSDTTARQLESLSPLYLPAAKTYPGCTTLCPWLTVFSPELPQPEIIIRMEIHRNGESMYGDEYGSSQMKRTPESLVRHARTLAAEPDGTFEAGFALFTGTGIIPPIQFALEPGDIVTISSPQLGRLQAETKVVQFGF